MAGYFPEIIDLTTSDDEQFTKLRNYVEPSNVTTPKRSARSPRRHNLLPPTPPESPDTPPDLNSKPKCLKEQRASPSPTTSPARHSNVSSMRKARRSVLNSPDGIDSTPVSSPQHESHKESITPPVLTKQVSAVVQGASRSVSSPGPIQNLQCTITDSSSTNSASDTASDTGSVSGSDKLPRKRKQFPATRIDEDLRRLMRYPIKMQKKVLDEEGCIYIVRDRTQPGLLKIGLSKEPETRKAQHAETCGKKLKDVGVENGLDQTLFRFARRAEALIHKELQNFQVTPKCSCGTKHREYFQISNEHALRVVKRWTKFIQSTPYGSDRQLARFFDDRVQHMPRALYNESPEDHLIRHQRWNTALFATNLEYAVFWFKQYLFQEFKARSRWEILKQNRWLVYCLAEGFIVWVVPGLYLRSIFVLFFMALLVDPWFFPPWSN